MTKDKKSHPERMETKKYCRFCKSHTLHKETKQSLKGSECMGDSKETSKTPFFKGVKAEFKKIFWPDKNTLAKQTVAVVSVSVILGVIISIVDIIVKYGIDILVR